jgi:chemotaxis methyl-accepting protein methylase/mannose-6-phosphate isomerase-like protein (cupin superfamily)
MKTMEYVYTLPTLASFDGKGLSGYNFGPLEQKDLEIYYIDVRKGHDTFMVSKKINRTYYVLDGSGYFTIANHKYNVRTGMLVEVPRKVEYSYSGQMKLIAFSRPRWFNGNDTHTKWNPDVVEASFPSAADDGSWVSRLVRLTIFGKSPTSAFLRLNRRVWDKLPASFTALKVIRSYGNFLHALVRMHSFRGQLFHTFFLRNRPTLELIRRLVERNRTAHTLRVAVLGCSYGAEAYSVAWRIRSARPDLKLMLQAVDISTRAVETAKSGVYPAATSRLFEHSVFEGMTEEEIDELFLKDGDRLTVREWIREGIEWRVDDVQRPEIVEILGPQDIVVANNFLCHMDASVAEKCLRNIARLVAPHGYLFVSGIDLEIRTKVAQTLGWQPVQELLEEIHEGDPHMAHDWPWNYSALEPLNKKRKDWRLRYASSFQLVPAGDSARPQFGERPFRATMPRPSAVQTHRRKLTGDVTNPR